ncbi:unnamed protein product [Knipowitschia caucasica]
MDDTSALQTQPWTKTKEAIANFRKLLQCSKCSHLMKDPVCLGMCEHWLCRSCSGARAGEGCVVCLSPAWVQDVQINRQLSSIIELFCGLDKLLSPTATEDSTKQETPAANQKKNFKIWFSPRSRKIRCLVEKASEETAPERSPPGTTAADTTNPPKDLSVFNFTSSSQDSGSPQTRNSIKRNQRRGKKSAPSRKRASVCAAKNPAAQKLSRLQAVNEQWGISEGPVAFKDQPPCIEPPPRRSGKRVSFGGPAVTSNPPCAPLPQGTPNELSPGTVQRTVLETKSNDQAAEPNTEILHNSEPSCTPPAGKCETESNAERKKENEPSPAVKRSRAEENGALDLTPKRPRPSPGSRRRPGGRGAPCVLSSPSLSSPACSKATRSPRVELGDSPSTSPSSISTKSPRLCSGSPAVMKRNHKGETPLHIAAIKGDAETVRKLLEQEADPNLKDNAGWTPLHEACNLGHLAVVEILVSMGALLNTPGYKNETPLHDAVRNGHSAVVRRLLQLGASTNLLNLYGKRPSDYAASREMLEIFQETTERTATTALSPAVVKSSVGRSDGTLVFVSSKLSASEQQQLCRLGRLLRATISDAVTEAVTHVVVPDGQMPTTFSSLLGVLMGSWVVHYSCKYEPHLQTRVGWSKLGPGGQLRPSLSF